MISESIDLELEEIPKIGMKKIEINKVRKRIKSKIK